MLSIRESSSHNNEYALGKSIYEQRNSIYDLNALTLFELSMNHALCLTVLCRCVSNFYIIISNPYIEGSSVQFYAYNMSSGLFTTCNYSSAK